MATLTDLAKMNFDFGEFVQFLTAENFQNQTSKPLKVSNMVVFQILNTKNIRKLLHAETYFHL